MDRDAEIAEIRRELDILRTRRALYAKMGNVLKTFFTIIVPLFAVVVAVVSVMMVGTDALIAGFFAVLTAAFSIIVWLVISIPTSEDLSVGGIDPGSPSWRYRHPPHSLLSFMVAARTSDAKLLEQQIATRERRLAELGVQS